MDPKSSTDNRSGAVSSGGGDSYQWWRWSGKSGSISSSSDSVSHGHHSGGEHSFSGSTAATTASSSSSLSPSPSESLRWQKRASSSTTTSTRAGLAAAPREGGEQYTVAASSSFGGMWSASSPSPSGGSGSSSSSSSPSSSSGASSPSPKFFSASSSMISARGLPSTTRKMVSTASLSRSSTSSSSVHTTRDAAALKKKIPASLSPSSTSAFPSSSTNQFGLSSSSGYGRCTTSSSSAASAMDRQSQSEIAWSLGPSKRRVGKREKKSSKTTPAQPRRASLYAPRAIRPIPEEGRERFTSTSSSSHGFAGSRTTLASQPILRFDNRFETSNNINSSSPLPTSFADKALSPPKDRVLSSPASSFASTASSSYASSPSYLKKDPLVNCARAVLQDCIMKRRMERSSSMRKRNIEDCVKSDSLNSKSGAYMSKSSECGILSSCSSSSDDELSQLSSMERSFNSIDKFDDDYKLSKEELYRELMLGDNGLSSSPDFERFSPFLEEEKGLPVEIRYQLPLALGTANEIDKECTICQIRYGIGDHIVTLPCQHFFHACCVDKWLWNHISCPLCRTEVTLDMETDASTTKHNFTECSELDQETIRRKMRSTSQSAGFRPVVPVNVELDQLQNQLASLSVQETNQPNYLVCPKPQRPHSK